MKKREREKILSLGKKFFLFPVIMLLAFSCTFDYGEDGDAEKNRPDIVMENIEYVRVRKGDPLVRFQAEYAERWEDRQTMELKYFSFEQMEDQGGTINAEGRAGAAVVQIGSGDISLYNGVRINVESEDIIILTSGLEWKDKEKILSGDEHDEVEIERRDGTKFTGMGFTADARHRTWSFSGEVKGHYVESEKDDEEKEKAPDTTGEEWTRERPVYQTDDYSTEEYEPRPAIPAPVLPKITPDKDLPSIEEEK